MGHDDATSPQADATPPDTAADATGPAIVTRSVEIDAPTDEVWEAIADPERQALWLDDDDALLRTRTVPQVDPGRSMAWTWQHPDDDASSSRVEITVEGTGTGGSRVTVTEQLVGTGPIMYSTPTTPTGIPERAVLHLWDRRLLGLELLFVTAGAGIGLRLA